MTAAMLVLEPIFEADLPPEQYAYRPGRNAQQAVIEVGERLHRGQTDVVDADLADYFASIPHAESMLSLARRIVDRRVLHLIRMWLECPVEETDDRGGKTRTTEAKDSRRGIPQGSPISPLLANVYMRRCCGRRLGLLTPSHGRKTVSARRRYSGALHLRPESMSPSTRRAHCCACCFVSNVR
jgi:RNA-directed DNA polymerase